MKPKAPNEHEDGLLEYLEDIVGTSKVLIYIPFMSFSFYPNISTILVQGRYQESSRTRRRIERTPHGKSKPCQTCRERKGGTGGSNFSIHPFFTSRITNPISSYSHARKKQIVFFMTKTLLHTTTPLYGSYIAAIFVKTSKQHNTIWYQL